MPPHCDALDGPVVKAAIEALEKEDVNLVLPYVHEPGEAEVVSAFRTVQEVRRGGPAAKQLADDYFFETVVRVHRAGEGAPYTGLKPAGLDIGPAIPLAEEALETGSGDRLVNLLCHAVEEEVRRRLEHALSLKPACRESVAAGREYVQAMLGLQVYSNGVYQAIRSEPHAAEAEAHH